jgi:outer membrane protein TolC
MAKLDADQALLSLKSLEQDIVVAVDDAVGHVETNLKSVEATRAATRLAEESLDAEKKKLLAGTSTTFLVLQAQTVLATARSAQIRAEADYHESLVALDLAEGTILAKNSIVLDEKY